MKNEHIEYRAVRSFPMFCATKTSLRLFASAFLIPCCFGQQSVIQEKSTTTEILRGVSAPGKGVIWASGTHGTYLRSIDNGNTWRAAQVSGAESLDFRDVEAFSADVAYLLSAGPGDQSRIYKTVDSGKSWSLQFTNKEPRGFLDCMAFWDENHGITIGDPLNGRFEILITDDGKNWTSTSSPSMPAAIEGEGAFAASGSCVAVQGKNDAWFATGGKAARVFRSKDHGKSWNLSDTPIAHGTDSSGIFSIAFRDSKHGIIAGGDYKDSDKEEANLAFTSDGGATWKRSPISPQWYFSAVAFDSRDRQTVWVVGTSGAAYADDATASSWIRKWPVNVNAVAFSPTGDAFAVGPNGTIVHFVKPTLSSK